MSVHGPERGPPPHPGEEPTRAEQVPTRATQASFKEYKGFFGRAKLAFTMPRVMFADTERVLNTAKLILNARLPNDVTLQENLETDKTVILQRLAALSRKDLTYLDKRLQQVKTDNPDMLNTVAEGAFHNPKAAIRSFKEAGMLVKQCAPLLENLLTEEDSLCIRDTLLYGMEQNCVEHLANYLNVLTKIHQKQELPTEEDIQAVLKAQIALNEALEPQHEQEESKDNPIAFNRLISLMQQNVLYSNIQSVRESVKSGIKTPTAWRYLPHYLSLTPESHLQYEFHPGVLREGTYELEVFITHPKTRETRRMSYSSRLPSVLNEDEQKKCLYILDHMMEKSMGLKEKFNNLYKEQGLPEEHREAVRAWVMDVHTHAPKHFARQSKLLQQGRFADAEQELYHDFSNESRRKALALGNIYTLEDGSLSLLPEDTEESLKEVATADPAVVETMTTAIQQKANIEGLTFNVLGNELPITVTMEDKQLGEHGDYRSVTLSLKTLKGETITYTSNYKKDALGQIDQKLIERNVLLAYAKFYREGAR